VTREPSLAGRAFVAVLLPVALFAAVVAQLTIVNRLPLPGGDAPDLVLLLVAAVAAVSTPLIGAVTGFFGGLGLDVAPPSTHYAGEYALVFCVVGYAVARVRTELHTASRTGERDPVTTWTVMVAGVAAGEVGKAALGRMLSDQDVTNAAIRHVLPGALLYDLLLSPLVLWLVSLVARLAQPRPERAPHGHVPGFGHAVPAFRLAAAGAPPGLRAAGAGPSYLTPALARTAEPRLRFAGSGWVMQAAPPAHRELRLRLAGAGRVNHGPPPRREPRLRFDGSSAISRAPARARREPRLRLAGSGGIRNSQPRPRREPRLRFDGSSALGKSRSLARREPRLRLSAGRARSIFRVNGGVTPGGQPPLAGGRAAKLNFATHSPRLAPARRVRTPGRNWLRGASPGYAGQRTRRAATPRFSAGRSAPEWAAGNVLRTPRAVKRTPRRGWLRPDRGQRPNWYTGARSTSWLRRSRNPWRRRRQRLLELVGGRR